MRILVQAQHLARQASPRDTDVKRVHELINGDAFQHPSAEARPTSSIVGYWGETRVRRAPAERRDGLKTMHYYWKLAMTGVCPVSFQ